MERRWKARRRARPPSPLHTRRGRPPRSGAWPRARTDVETVSRRSCARSWPHRHAWACGAPYEPFCSLDLLRLARQVDLPVGAVARAVLNLYGRTTLKAYGAHDCTSDTNDLADLGVGELDGLALGHLLALLVDAPRAAQGPAQPGPAQGAGGAHRKGQKRPLCRQILSQEGRCDLRGRWTPLARLCRLESSTARSTHPLSAHRLTRRASSSRPSVLHQVSRAPQSRPREP